MKSKEIGGRIPREYLESRYGDKTANIQKLYKEFKKLNSKIKNIKDIRKNFKQIFAN